MLPIEMLREIASHWPARNGLPRTCRQLAHGNPGPSAYACQHISTHDSDTLMRTMLPDGTLHGAATVTRDAETLTVQYDLGRLISGVYDGDTTYMFETTDFVGNPYLLQSWLTTGIVLSVCMRAAGSVVWISLSHRKVQVGVSTPRNPFALHTLDGTFDGSTMDDVRMWYRENERKVLDAPGVLDVVGAVNPYVQAIGGSGLALARIAKTLGYDPLPGMRSS